MTFYNSCIYFTEYQCWFLKGYRFNIEIAMILYFCITADMGRFNVSGFPWNDCYWTCSDASIQKPIGVGELQILVRLQKSDRKSSKDKSLSSEETTYRILKQFCHYRHPGWLKYLSYKKWCTELDSFVVRFNIPFLKNYPRKAYNKNSLSSSTSLINDISE